jgi:Sodium/hydrogen exchanger family
MGGEGSSSSENNDALDDYYAFVDDYYVNATNFTENYSYEEKVNVEEKSWVFVFFAVLLAIVLILNRFLHDLPSIHRYISEASLVLLVGIVAGFFVSNVLVLHNGNNNHYVTVEMEEDGQYIEVLAEYLLSFSPNIFFMAMLPPIIFHSGYVLHLDMFFRHIKPIMMLACVGTMLSAFITGLVLYGVVNVGWIDDTFKPSLLELLTFGSLIAATDTVSVLSVCPSATVICSILFRPILVFTGQFNSIRSTDVHYSVDPLYFTFLVSSLI